MVVCASAGSAGFAIACQMDALVSCVGLTWLTWIFVQEYCSASMSNAVDLRLPFLVFL